ncbi:MAG: Aerobic cobaltochelatase subunit CobS [Alphaproteobacteria bacterium ADurb.Bin438]|nr:MAG: Aerobic cobaltochelatase subunit CobS [Alphaproteobacteria bacterium ADurb.Bin438]
MDTPDTMIKVKEVFGIDSDLEVPAFSYAAEYVPDFDKDYYFDKDTTLSILAGFAYNRRVLVHGYHGTGKSSHIEQVAARLNWPCVRINLDSHISRMDLVGKDHIVLNNGKQITEFREGILPWALQRPMAIVFDEYDAGRPDVMFVIQRVLEADSKLALIDQNRVIEADKHFRLFATANTVGLGDSTGLYQGTQQINQAQMDRWSIVVALNYLEEEQEFKIVRAKSPSIVSDDQIKAMIRVANLVRQAFIKGEISTVISPRTLIAWAENAGIFKNIGYSFHLSFLNRCDEAEKDLIANLYKQGTGLSLKMLSVIR